MEAFLDFYREHGVLPVHYENNRDFRYRRNWLYAKLGVPPALVTGKTVIEFGPGTGDNATVVAELQPASYVLVEANSTAILSLENKLSDKHFGFVEVQESRVLDFTSPSKFSLVIAENIIPGRYKSVQFAEHILGFVEPGGVAVLTTQTSAGLLADICRHLLRPEIQRRVANAKEDGSFEDQVNLAAEIFSDDIASLGQSTRSATDWAVDNVLHDWLDRDRTFTPKQALEALTPEFDFLASSPSFDADTRWFKHVKEEPHKSMDLFLDALDRNIPALVDHRIPLGTDMAHPDRALAILDRLFELRDAILKQSSYAELPEFLEGLQELAGLLPMQSEPTRLAIQEFAHPGRGIGAFIDGGRASWGPAFTRWWGRSTLYLSFWRLP